ncbi:MAG: N-acetylneuraminate synthase family protein [Sandaracinaceae bacterium]|nr:N-acetylneuraminate synthase family protein [Sandaracinaceae bacterium]
MSTARNGGAATARRLGAGGVYVIAEAGANHDRDLAKAHALIDAAAEARADAVKFQVYTADGLYSRHTPVFPGESRRPHDVIREVELPRAWEPELQAHARERGLDYFATPFDYEAVDAQAALGVPCFKWASSEINDLPMLAHAARHGLPMILSTGMCDLSDVQAAVDTVRSVGNEQIVLLHCSALYPTPLEEVNLRAMQTLASAFGLPVGYSDHTLGIAVPTAAVALGASVIEKHFTLDRRAKGPDHPYALEPQELAAMVRQIRDVERALGSAIKAPTPGERAKRHLSRRSLVTTRDLRAGETLRREDVMTKRPGTGLEPRLLEVVVGRSLRSDVPEGTPLTWEML